MQLNKKEEKRLYDIEYRRKNLESIKKRKKKYYNLIKNTPEHKETQRRYNQKKMVEHVEYCRRPDQKIKTKKRDQIRRHGEYRECYELIEEIFIFIRDYYEKNDEGVHHKYLRLKERGYFFNKTRNR